MSLQRSAPVPARFTAVLLCILSLLGHLGSVAHQVFEEHTVCAAHGELIHTDKRQPPKHASKRAALEASPGEDAHDHCWAPAHRDDDYVALSATPTVFDHGTPSATGGSAPSRTTWLASIGVLSLAPKQSPPRSNG